MIILSDQEGLADPVCVGGALASRVRTRAQSIGDDRFCRYSQGLSQSAHGLRFTVALGGLMTAHQQRIDLPIKVQLCSRGNAVVEYRCGRAIPPESGTEYDTHRSVRCIHNVDDALGEMALDQASGRPKRQKCYDRTEK